MNLQECYAAIGGDYADAIARLRSERLVQKFVLKFLNDSSYELLCKSLEEGNGEEAFRAAHTIKGVCQNLAFITLLKSSSALSESLRSGISDNIDALVQQVADDYQKTVSAIRTFQEGIGE